MFVLQLQILAQYREEKMEEFPNSNYEPTLKALGMYWSALFLFSLHSLQTKWEEKHRWCLALYRPVWSPGHRCSEDLQRWAFYPEEWTKIHFFSPSAQHRPRSRIRWLWLPFSWESLWQHGTVKLKFNLFYTSITNNVLFFLKIAIHYNDNVDVLTIYYVMN